MQELKFSNPITGSEVSVYDGADSKYVLFEGYSICKLLGYANPARTIEQLVSSKYIRRVRGILGRNRLPKVLLTEPGVYQLAIKSRAKRAEQFQAWVFEEVLPSIHHNGGYISGQEKLEEDEKKQLLAQIRKLADDNKMLIGENKQLRKDLDIREKAFDKLSERVIDIANDIVHSSMEDNLFEKSDKYAYRKPV